MHFKMHIWIKCLYKISKLSFVLSFAILRFPCNSTSLYSIKAYIYISHVIVMCIAVLVFFFFLSYFVLYPYKSSSIIIRTWGGFVKRQWYKGGKKHMHLLLHLEDLFTRIYIHILLSCRHCLVLDWSFLSHIPYMSVIFPI